MFNNNCGYSLADVAAATGNNGMFGNEGGAWWIIILFLFCFMGGAGNGMWGGYNKQPATTDDVQNQFNFAALERQNNETVASVRQAAYDVTGAVKDGHAALNSEFKDMTMALGTGIRDVKDVVQANNYEIGKGFAATNSNIDSVRYDNAINTKELLASNCAQTQKILDAITTNRMADMQNQINALQLQAATGNVVRYPSATVFTAGPAPVFSPCCGNPYWNNPAIPGIA